MGYGAPLQAPLTPTPNPNPSPNQPYPLPLMLQGFDLGSFMHAVTCAVEPHSGPGAPTLERGSSNALNENDLHDLFEVSLG